MRTKPLTRFRVEIQRLRTVTTCDVCLARFASVEGAAAQMKVVIKHLVKCRRDNISGTIRVCTFDAALSRRFGTGHLA